MITRYLYHIILFVFLTGVVMGALVSYAVHP